MTATHKGADTVSGTASIISIPQNSEKSTSKAQKNNSMHYSFAGENAKTADPMRLDDAKKRIAAGEDSEAVRRETGWFQGLDGKWRFEIDDSKMVVAKGGVPSDYKEYCDLTRKQAFNITSKEEDQRLQTLKRNFSEIPYDSLAYYVKHDALFAAYPELLSCRFSFYPMDGGAASYDIKNNRIYADCFLSMEELKPLLIHEIQHAVQIIEGLAIGANATYWEKELYGKKEYEQMKTPEKERDSHEKSE